MTNWDRIRNDNEDITKDIIVETRKYRSVLEDIAIETERATHIARSSSIIIDDFDRNFEKATKLTKTDIKFLFFAIALQCIRQYIIGTLTQRTTDFEAAKKIKGDNHQEHSNRNHRYYNPSLEEIINNPVPFDANIGSNGILKGGGKLGHRATAIGHDPILGLVIGTANIATSTLTTWDFQSYHIKTGLTRKKNNSFSSVDVFGNKARTDKVLLYTKDKLTSKDLTQKIIVATALGLEVQHLQSDIYSKNSLPIPIVSHFSPQLASELAKYGADMGNMVKVGGQLGFSMFINQMISMLHGICFDKTKDISWKMYSVKTCKILNYSNIVATTSNVIAVAIGAVIGSLTNNPNLINKSINYLDIGGVIATIYRVINDRKFILQIKKEFLEHEWYDMIMS